MSNSIRHAHLEHYDNNDENGKEAMDKVFNPKYMAPPATALPYAQGHLFDTLFRGGGGGHILI